MVDKELGLEVPQVAGNTSNLPSRRRRVCACETHVKEVWPRVGGAHEAGRVVEKWSFGVLLGWSIRVGNCSEVQDR